MAGFESRWGGGRLAPVPKSAASRKKKKSSHWYDGITGFIGHLGGDVRDAVVGIPMGAVNLFKDPVGSFKEMGKATWHDWSPLFHGDVREWADNFYEHPLGPILDVASVLTLGAGSVAKGASGLSKAGAVSKTGRVAKFADPRKARMHELLDEGTRRVGPRGAPTYASKRLELDPAGSRLIEGKSGVVSRKSYHTNPIVRARQKGLALLGEKVAQSSTGKALKADKIMGNEAFAKRWRNMDGSRRQTGSAVMQQRELAEIHKLGKKISGMSRRQLFDKIEGTMRKGIVGQAHEVAVRGRSSDQLARDLQADGYVLLKDDPHLDRKFANKYLDKNTDKALVDALKVWGKDQTTRRLENAKQGSQPGTVLVVSGKSASKLGKEAVNSSKVARLFYEHPTMVWKWMVLAASPRYFVNNVIGNTLMLAMSANPVIMTRAFSNHVRTTMGGEKARRAMTDVQRAQSGVAGLDWTERIYAGEHQGWGQSELRDIANPGKVGAKIPRRVREGLFPITHKFSDTHHRAIAMNYAIMRAPEYQAHYAQLRSSGKGHIDAHNEAASRASESARVRDYVREEVNHTLGQYHHFTKFERSVKRVIPFYAWDRAITRHTAEMVKNRPYQAAMVAAIGERGTQATEDMLGNIPDFLKGVIPVSEGAPGILKMIAGDAPGRRNLLMTQGMNPYATIGDLTETGMSVTGLTGGQRVRMGDSLGGQLNPVLAGLIESVSGASMVSGAPIPPRRGGLLANIYLKSLENVPAAKLGQTIARKYGAFGGYEKPKDPSHPFLFAKNAQTDIAGFVGMPTKQADMSKVSELYRRQHGVKKGRKQRSMGSLLSSQSTFKSRLDIPAL